VSAPPAAIERLRIEVHALVMARGFETAMPHADWTGKYNVLSWLRRTWREDTIRLGWRSHAGSYYFIDVQWSVPRQEGPALVAAGINPSYLRRRVQWQSWPRQWPLVGRLIERRWRAAVLLDLEFGLAWLERCSSPAGALQELKNPERNGPQEGSKAYAQIEHYIRAQL
jgi:hypothetical protein